MAPREQPKTPPNKTNISKKGSKFSSVGSVIKKTMPTVKKTDKTPLKAINSTKVEHQRSKTVQMTPKSKEMTSAAVAPGSVTKSGKKSLKRKPKPAHSGVPIPDKMRKLIQKQLAISDL